MPSGAKTKTGELNHLHSLGGILSLGDHLKLPDVKVLRVGTTPFDEFAKWLGIEHILHSAYQSADKKRSSAC